MTIELSRGTWDHLVIPFPGSGLGYAVAIAPPWVAVYGVRLTEPRFLPPEDLPNVPAFVVKMHETADWRTVGNAVVDSLSPGPRRTYRVQLGYPPVFRLIEPDDSETVVDETACDGVEPATTWHPEEVTTRLASWLAGDRDVPRIRIPKSLLGAPPPVPKPRGEIARVGSEFVLEFVDHREPDSSQATLVARGFQGGGASWAAIVRGLEGVCAPWLSGVTLDEEADALVVRSPDREPLDALSHLLGEVKIDQRLFDAAIDKAIAEGWME